MPWIPFFGRAGLRGSGVLSTGRMQDGTRTGRERWPVTRTFSGATSREVDPTRIHRATRTTENAIDGDGFVARAYLPGHLEPEDTDHGRGPLATIMESFLAPGTHIKLHEHAADEIVLLGPDRCDAPRRPRGRPSHARRGSSHGHERRLGSSARRARPQRRPAAAHAVNLHSAACQRFGALHPARLASGAACKHMA